jgi:DNA-binding protein Fis
MEQPDILGFIHEHLDAALDANANEVDVDDVRTVYQMVLVEVLALSYAVRAPANWTMPAAEFTA